MENGSILIVIIIAAIIGRRSICIGSLCGVAATLIFFFVFETYSLKSFAVELLFGILTSIVVSTMANILLPGLKGGDHNSGPTFIGGGDKGGIHSGIVPTDQELKARKGNQNKIP